MYDNYIMKEASEAYARGFTDSTLEKAKQNPYPQVFQPTQCTAYNKGYSDGQRAREQRKYK